nr:response regulator [Spirochaetales bacterium]
QILSFSRRGDQELLPVNLVPLVKEVMKLLRGSIPSTIAFELDIAPEDLIVKGDPTQFHQVVMNLCTNSYHAMLEEGGILSISLQPWHNVDSDSGGDDDRVKLTVTDTGCGMDEELQLHIFEPYFTTKKQGEGSGVGLSVVLGIIQHHGGDIKVESGPGQGTTVTVILPRLIKEWVAKNDDNARGDYPIGQEKIIIVDDEPMNVMLLENMLQSLGYSVTGFHNSEDALMSLQADPSQYDLLISDMTMPNLTGKQLAQAVLELRPQMPVILCTGHSESLDKKAAMSLGIMDYVAKPLSLKTLADSVRYCLDAKKNVVGQ